MRYAKSVLHTGTSVDLVAYRYFTKNYYSFSEMNNQQFDSTDEQRDLGRTERRKSSFGATFSQDLGRFGSLYLNGNRDEFRGANRVSNSLSIGYHISLYGVSYGLNYGISRVKSNDGWPENRQLSLNIQLPLSLFTSSPWASRSYANYSLMRQRDGGSQQQANLSGSLLDSRISYNLAKGWSEQGNNSGSLSLGYQGNLSDINAGYSTGSGYSAMNGGINGGLLLHPKGITLSKTLGSSIAVVSTPDAEGVRLMSGGSSTNAQGISVLPYMSHYQKNTLSIDPTTLPDGVDVGQSSLALYPTKGAVVMAEFKTRIGYHALLSLKKAGKPVPFGAMVNVEQPEQAAPHSAIVGDQGQVYLSGLAEKGRLQVSWGSEDINQCVADYDLTLATPISDSNGLRVLALVCHN